MILVEVLDLTHFLFELQKILADLNQRGEYSL